MGSAEIPIIAMGSMSAIGGRLQGCIITIEGVRALAQGDGRHSMKLPHRRQFLHLAAGAAALPAVSRIATAQTYVRIV